MTPVVRSGACESFTRPRSWAARTYDVIREYLSHVTYGSDGWVQQLRLPGYSEADVIVDPHQALGRPLVVHGGARVEDLVDRFRAGDGVDAIAEDFDAPAAEVEDVIRVALRVAA